MLSESGLSEIEPDNDNLSFLDLLPDEDDLPFTADLEGSDDEWLGAYDDE